MMPADDNDWRLTNQENYLRRATLTFRRYRAPRPDWDHDHCEFCHTKFMEQPEAEILTEGYCTLDEYRWVCPACFEDFKDRFGWEVGTIVDPPVPTQVEGEPVALELPRLLEVIYRMLARREAEPTEVATALAALLRFLASPAGRTNANCVAADRFFSLHVGWHDVSWEGAPAGLRDVFDNIEHGLHDTISAPEIAKNFDATPEQLLAALQKTGLVA